ncbi:hypothetical protein, partial [Pseudomonas sp. PE-S1G-1]|uniref:hypothetical protein n=1 Tax=Pseudomonas sp. PE-S1G-1 TaxID=1986995 RepID=UPI001C469EB1
KQRPERKQICFSVGAGLPAMQTPRYIRHTEAMSSPASQLLQCTVPALAFDFAFNTPVGFQAAVLLICF